MRRLVLLVAGLALLATVAATVSGGGTRVEGDYLQSAVFSPNGRLVLTGSCAWRPPDETARIWDAASGRSLRVLNGHRDLISTAVFNPGGAQVVTASWDGTARIWDAAGGRSLHILRRTLRRSR